MTIVTSTHSIARTTVGVACLWVLAVSGGGALLQAQENQVLEENASFDQTSPGNVAQKAQMSYFEGLRDLKLANQLERRASEAEPGEKRDKLNRRSAEAYEKAVQKFRGALRQRPEMIEAYESLGEAFRHQGKYQEALEIHAIALRQDSEDMDNFRGWAASLMALNMLGNATQSYATYVETKSPRAEILMGEMKRWLAAKQTDPGDLDPAHVERMASWIAEQSQSG